MGEIQATAEGYRAEPVRHAPLEVIDVSAEARAVTDAYRNLVLCQGQPALPAPRRNRRPVSLALAPGVRRTLSGPRRNPGHRPRRPPRAPVATWASRHRARRHRPPHAGGGPDREPVRRGPGRGHGVRTGPEDAGLSGAPVYVRAVAILRLSKAGLGHYRHLTLGLSTCNAGWRTPGPSSLPLAADRLPMWAPQELRCRAVSPPLRLRPLPEARHGRRSRQ
jgi:hypothetical protein